MRVQLWSYNFNPEPTGIGAVSSVLARGLRDRGHQLEVVAAHPHYPEPIWGSRIRPYREIRDGIVVFRLPLWVGRATAVERYRQELSFMLAQSAVTPFLHRPDVLISASPSFPALLPAVGNVRIRDIPWVLWLHDLLPDGATASGIVDEASGVITLARRLERLAYQTADKIVVLSNAFTGNLLAKGVPGHKITLIYDPATRIPENPTSAPEPHRQLRILSMGNIGHTQGLTPLVRAFESRPDLTGDASLIITGTGVAAEEARAEVRSDRVDMAGMVSDERLERELVTADIALVSQHYDGSEFNIPSKLMNFMAYGLPILAAVNPGGEVAALVAASGGGWVVDSSEPDAFATEIRRLTSAHSEIAERAALARSYASKHFTQAGFAERFDRVIAATLSEHRRTDLDEEAA